HLPRIARRAQALPHGNALATSAAPLLGEFLRGRGGDGVLVGPDEESRQWVEQVALASGLPFVIATKERLGDREVRIALPAYPYRGADAILVDDRSEEHTSELQSRENLVCRLLLEKKK